MTCIQIPDPLEEARKTSVQISEPLRWRGGGGRYYGNGKFLLRVFIIVYYGLLQFITEFCYGCYGTFLKGFTDSEPRHQKSLETLVFEKKPAYEP